MTYVEFQRELANKQLKSIYCFLGEEEFLAEQGARAVVDAVLPGQERDFGLADVAQESHAAEVRRAMLSPSFFGTRRVVRVKDPGKMDAEAQDAMAANLAKLPQGTVLIISGALDKRRASSKTLLAAAAVVDCPLPKRGEAIAWAQARAKAKGISLDTQAANFLVETVGTGLRRIDTELEKALTYLGRERSNLTVADLALLLDRDKEDDVFALAEAATAGKMGDALQILADLLAMGEPEAKLMPIMESQVRKILLAGYLRAQGKKSSEIAPVIGVPPFVAEKIVQVAAKIPPTRCHAILERMALADYRIKTGERDARLEMELLVMEMAR